jgi:molybdopterin converting factor small subunit
MFITVMCQGLPGACPGRAGIEIDQLGPLALGDLITRQLATRYGPDFVTALIDGDDLHPGYVVLINGRNATQVGGLQAAVADGATVLFTVPVSGG